MYCSEHFVRFFLDLVRGNCSYSPTFSPSLALVDLLGKGRKPGSTSSDPKPSTTHRPGRCRLSDVSAPNVLRGRIDSSNIRTVEGQVGRAAVAPRPGHNGPVPVSPGFVRSTAMAIRKDLLFPAALFVASV